MSRKFIFGGSFLSIPPLDPDAVAFLTAAAITDPTITGAINTLVVDLKGYGIWTKMKALYPFVGGTANTHKFNLVNPLDTNAAFRLVFFGGWTHSNTGAKPNGTNGYADTFLVPSVVQNVNSNGIGVSIRTNLVETSGDTIQIGSLVTIAQCSVLALQNVEYRTRLNSNVLSSLTGASKVGLWTTQKTSATLTNNYKNNLSVASGNSGGTLSTVSFYLGNLNINNIPYAAGYTLNEFTFSFISDGLNATEVTNLNTSINTFNTALSR
jgi:hypothetical protein